MNIITLLVLFIATVLSIREFVVNIVLPTDVKKSLFYRGILSLLYTIIMTGIIIFNLVDRLKYHNVINGLITLFICVFVIEKVVGILSKK